jgi:AcrR family transcriptional regulator
MPSPVRNRRPNRKEIRSSILQIAREIAAADGWSAVTVRKVAEQIGYTAPIIYEHFGSKDEMLDQILKEAYDGLHVSIVEATEKATTEDGRVRAIVMTYWGFAHNTPELYQLMYGMEGARATSEAARDYAQPIVKHVTNEIIRFNPERINKDNVLAVMIEAWSLLHGMIALDISGYIGRYMEDRSQLPDVLVGSVLNILRRQ